MGICIQTLKDESLDDVKKTHAAATLACVTRSVLSKNMAGWEVMEVFAGGVNASDSVFKVGACRYLSLLYMV